MRRLKIRDLPSIPGLPLVNARIPEGPTQRRSFRHAVNLRQRRHNRKIAADLDLGIGQIQLVYVQAPLAHPVQLLQLGHHLPGGSHPNKFIGQQLVHGARIVG